MTSSYRPTEAIAILKPVFRLHRIPKSQTCSRIPRASFSSSCAPHATHSTSKGPAGIQRRAVTVTNDTGSVRWGELSTKEKAARTTQQGINLGVVIVGVVLTGTVSYFLFTDVFSPNSKTAFYNRSVSLIRAHRECQSLLGPGPEISARGEASWSRMARNRFLASSEETDKWGTEHLKFRFYVEGPLDKGTVHVHLVRRGGEKEFVYEELSVDVKGHKRVYVEGGEEKGKVAPKIFGARWW